MAKRQEVSPHPERGKLLHLKEIEALTRLPENTIRYRYHQGKFPPLWKMGARLVAWERDVLDWMDSVKERTSKTQ